MVVATGALVIRIAASGSHPTAAALKHCVGECQEGVRALRQEGEAVAHLAAPPGVAVNRHYRPSPLHACDQHRASGPLRTDQHSVRAAVETRVQNWPDWPFLLPSFLIAF